MMPVFSLSAPVKAERIIPTSAASTARARTGSTPASPRYSCGDSATPALGRLRQHTEEFKGRKIGGKDKIAETDGAYFGGFIRPSNFKENRIDRRKAANQNGKRQSVVIIRQRNGNSLPMVFKSESAALSWIKSRVEFGTVINADESAAWDALASKYEMRRINHQEAYSDGEACTNQAESYFSRLRRAEMGHHHHVSGPYLLRYAQESAFREDARRVDNGAQVRRVTELALKRGPSVDFSGYYQRHVKAA